MVPSEHTSGPKRRIGAITKAGDVHARTLLIEAAHSYRYPARIGRHKLAAVDAVPEAVRAIAWKAQTRLCQRYRHMMARGKLKQVVVTAIARELAGFVWSIACITSDPVVSNNVVTESYDEATATRDNVTMASEESAQKVHRITPDTDLRAASPVAGRRVREQNQANQGGISREEPDGMIAQHHSTG
jgi:hypothetical protein